MTTTNKTRGTARTTAAPKLVEPRAEFIAQAQRLHEAVQTMSAMLYDAVMFARENRATEAELSLLLAEVPKQRRSDFKTVFAAPEGIITDGAPTNLAKLAQFVRARNKGATAAVAKQFAEQKIDAAGLARRLGQEPPKPRKSKGATGPDARNDSANPWVMLHDGVEGLRKELAADGMEEALLILADITDLLDDLKAFALGEDAPAGEVAK